MIDPQVAFDKLAQFQTADELADYLQSCNIKAFPGRIDGCALAAWFQETVESDPWSTTVTTEMVFMPTQDGGTQCFELTPMLKEFIARFDTEQYPELIAPSAHRIFKVADIERFSKGK